MNSYFRQQRLQHPADKIRRRGRRLSVPPLTSTREGPSANHSAGSTVCSTSVQLPALPIAKRYSPPRTVPPEDQTLRPQLRAFHRCPTNFRSRFYRGQMLAQQPRFRPPGTNAGDGKWLAGYHRQAQRRAQDPPATCPVRHPAHHPFIIYPFTHTT